MATFCFAEGAAVFDSTPIENMFLLEHLPTAPEAYLRVYLYARMLALHPELGGDAAEMARALRLEEDAVYSAFAYWEQQGLARRLTDHPPTYELLPVRSDAGSAVGLAEANYYVYRDFNASLQAKFKAKVIESHEYRIANDWLNVLGFDQDAVLRMVDYGIDRARGENPNPATVFKRMNKLAAAWADRGCRTAEDVERAIAEDEGVSGAARAVLKRFAIHREPTMDELNCVRRWLGPWGYSEKEILAACEATTKSRAPTIAYLDAILKSRLDDSDSLWQELADILKELDAAQAQPTPDQLSRYAELKAAGFEPETVKLAAIQCHRKKQTRFEDMERMLKQWDEQGLHSREAAEAYIDEMGRKKERVLKILALCGLDRRVTMNDLSLYDGWRKVHDDAVIDYAADCARGMKLPMAYMDKLLESWSDAGVRTVEAARAEHEAARAARPAGGTGAAPANPALDYTQRRYTDEDYGDDFFIDLDKYGEGGEGA